MTTTPQLWQSLTDDERYRRLLDAEAQRDDALALLRRWAAGGEQPETAARLQPGRSAPERAAGAAAGPHDLSGVVTRTTHRWAMPVIDKTA